MAEEQRCADRKGRDERGLEAEVVALRDLPNRRGPRHLGEKDRLVAVAVPLQYGAVELHDLQQMAHRRGERVQSQDVERVSEPVAVEALHVLPARIGLGVGQSGGDDLGAPVRRMDRLEGRPQQLRIGLVIGLARPEELEGGLVPDLPLADRDLAHARIRAPKTSPRAVAGHERAKEVRVVAGLRRCVEVVVPDTRGARSPLRGVEHDRQNLEARLGRQADGLIERREVRRARGGLRLIPVEHHPDGLHP